MVRHTPWKKRAGVSLANRYQLKIALSYIAIIVLMLVLLNTYPIIVSQDLIYQAKEASLSARADLIASSLTTLDALTAKDVSNVMSYFEDPGASRIVVTDPRGLVVYDNAMSDIALNKYALQPEIFRALTGKNVFYSNYNNVAFESFSAVPVINMGVVLGAVYLYEYDTTQAKLLQDLQTNMTSISIIIASVVVILSIIMSTALAKRLSELLRAIRLVREGEYSHRVPRRGRDELASLADEFNELTGRLQKTEISRRRFVSDASHELKTPLASIRLLADSILQTQSMDPATMKEFVADIGDESDRLSRMTEKLLALTRLDAEVFAPVSVLDLKQIVQRAAHRLAPLAEHAQVTLTQNMDGSCLIDANEDDTYQIVYNLIENAIKYNRPEGTVRLFLFTRENKVVLIVDDTGVGIPDDELPRIFERFYRVDKARSREAGGAGLGLSIVKNTIEQYGGTIHLESRFGESTRVTVTFPLSKGVEEDMS